MKTMAGKMKYLITVFFILGFQLQLPVTTLPANSLSGKGPYTEFGQVIVDKETLGGKGALVGERLVGKGSLLENEAQILEPKSGVNEPSTPLASSSLLNRDPIGDQDPFNVQYIEHVENPTLIKPLQPQTRSVNKDINNTRWARHSVINSKGDILTGLQDGLTKDPIDSSKSVINRIKDNLMPDVIVQATDRFADLSSNLTNRENIITANNTKSTNNGHKLDRDGKDYINNTLTIKSSDKQIVTDTMHSRADNTNGGALKNPYVKDVYWDPHFVTKCPKGFRDQTLKPKWRDLVENAQVVKMEMGCGSMQNRLITFNDSTKACVRYRLNSDQMQGEIYSYYLGKLLNIDYTPPTAMHTVSNSEQWAPVRASVVASQWSDNKPIIVTKWIQSLKPVYMPDELKDIKRKLHQENYHLSAKPPGQVCDLVQWSDLIVFDYISANLDRVVNNLFNLKWNPNMLEKPIHNLEQKRLNGDFGQYMFIDNESGLFHGYRLLDAYQSYHEQLLNSVCIFRESTVSALEKLYANGSAGDKLQQLYETNEKHHGLLPRMSKKNKQILQSRIQDVVRHIHRCKHNTAAIPKS